MYVLKSFHSILLTNIFKISSAFTFYFLDVLCMKHNTNTAAYLQWLYQPEWLQWSLAKWGHEGTWCAMLSKVPSRCDV